MTDRTMAVSPAKAGQPAASTNQLIVYMTFLLRRHARTVLFWGIGVTLFSVLLVLAFPAFEGTGALDISQYPEGMREAFNLQTLNEIEPFLSSQMFSFLPLVLMFVPITAFASAIVGAEERGSLDLLFGNPLPRSTFILATWLAIAILMIVMLAVLGTISWIAAVAIDVDLGLPGIMEASLNVFPITMAAGSLALLLSAMVQQRGMAIGIPVALMFLMYLIDVLGKISDTYAPLRNLSAFKAYGDPLQDGMPWAGVVVLIVISIALAALAIPAFERRDIYT